MNDILEDQTIHYIVRDYNKMFDRFHQLIEACKEYQDLLNKREVRIRNMEREIEHLKNRAEFFKSQLESKVSGISDKKLKQIIKAIEDPITGTIDKLNKRITALSGAAEYMQQLKEVLGQ